jgi:hypothetical protein
MMLRLCRSWVRRGGRDRAGSRSWLERARSSAGRRAVPRGLADATSTWGREPSPPVSLGARKSAKGWAIGAHCWPIYSVSWRESWSMAAARSPVSAVTSGVSAGSIRIGVRMLGVSPSVTSISARARVRAGWRLLATRDSGRRRSCPCLSSRRGRAGLPDPSDSIHSRCSRPAVDSGQHDPAISTTAAIRSTVPIPARRALQP